MTTPITLEERVTILETRLDTILPTLATKEDIARLDGKIDAVEERLNGKIDTVEERLNSKIDAVAGQLNSRIDAVEARLDAKIDSLENRLLIKFAALLIPVMGIAVALMKYL